ncbi:hypothetical protein Pmar_PMAR009879, partial [Perkinsus marinus ATCC 50983]
MNWSDAGDASIEESSDSTEEMREKKKHKKCMKNLTCEQLAKLRQMIRALETLECTPFPCDWKYSLSCSDKADSSESLVTVQESVSNWERYLVYYRKPR